MDKTLHGQQPALGVVQLMRDTDAIMTLPHQNPTPLSQQPRCLPGLCPPGPEASAYLRLLRTLTETESFQQSHHSVHRRRDLANYLKMGEIRKTGIGNLAG